MVEIVEVAPRDGLQNEKTLVSTPDKVALVDAAVRAGVRRVEVTAFVRPDRVPGWRSPKRRSTGGIAEFPRRSHR